MHAYTAWPGPAYHRPPLQRQHPGWADQYAQDGPQWPQDEPYGDDYGDWGTDQHDDQDEPQRDDWAEEAARYADEVDRRALLAAIAEQLQIGGAALAEYVAGYGIPDDTYSGSAPEPNGPVTEYARHAAVSAAMWHTPEDPVAYHHSLREMLPGMPPRDEHDPQRRPRWFGDA